MLEGDGTIASLVSNTGGNLLAGSSATTPGVLTIGRTAPGSYSQGAKGKMTELIAGAAAGQSGEVKVSGKASLAGSLVIQAVSSFAFAAGQTFEIMIRCERSDRPVQRDRLRIGRRQRSRCADRQRSGAGRQL